MKFETLTYSAHVTDYSVRASAPGISGRSHPPRGGFLPTSLSDFASRIWAWMNLQISSCLSGGETHQIVELCLPDYDPSEPGIIVTLNRSVLRRLRRYERQRVKGGFEVRAYDFSLKRHLTPGQLSEWMIRTYRWGRTHVYRLNLGSRALMWHAIKSAGLQGDAQCLRRTVLCEAPLSPD